MNCDQIRPMLNAFVDGELDTMNSSSVQAHVEGCPDCLGQLESLETLRSQVRGVPRHALSDAQRERMASFLPSSPSVVRPRFGWVPWYGFGALTTAMVWLIFAFLMRPESPIVDDMLTGHMRSLIPGHMVDVQSSDHHTVKPWFAGKVPVSPVTVDLKDQGFPLLGGRIDVIDRRPTAVLVFGHGAHVLSVYVLPSDQGIRVGEVSKNGYQVSSWMQGGLEYIAVTDTDRSELEKFEELYKGAK